jgi:hypothetical protein
MNEQMKKEEGQRSTYERPEVSDFGKVSVVTGAVGMTFLTDSALTGSMEFPGGGPR